jgi:hypothetical protein
MIFLDDVSMIPHDSINSHENSSEMLRIAPKACRTRISLDAKSEMPQDVKGYSIYLYIKGCAYS